MLGLAVRTTATVISIDCLRTILMGWLTEQREMKDHIAAGEPVVMDERARQELRALGYAGD